MKQTNIQLIHDALDELKFSVEEDSINNLVVYHDLLMKQNQKYNLTGHKDEDVSVKMNLLNSISALKAIENYKLNEIADIGTGAGLPGIPWSILRKDTQFYLVDNKPKKISFLKLVVEALDLTNVKLVQSNVFELKRKFSNLVFQAFGKIERVLQTIDIVLDKKGYAFIFASDINKIKSELDSAQGIQYKVKQFHLTQLAEYTRVLIQVRKI